SQPLERKRAIGFDKLIDQIAQGRRDPDAISSLAGRLAALDRQIDDEDRQRIATAANGTSLKALAGKLLQSVSPDVIEAAVIDRHGSVEAATSKDVEAVEADLRDEACAPLDDPNLRNLI